VTRQTATAILLSELSKSTGDPSYLIYQRTSAGVAQTQVEEHQKVINVEAGQLEMSFCSRFNRRGEFENSPNILEVWNNDHKSQST
jgi:hypothetical protein